MPIKCTENKERLSAPRLFLQAWAQGRPPSRRFPTVCGPPPIQPRSTAPGPWWVPPVSDHSGGTPAGERAVRAEAGPWAAFGFAVV